MQNVSTVNISSRFNTWYHRAMTDDLDPIATTIPSRFYPIQSPP